MNDKFMKEPIVKVEHLSHRYSIQWAVRDISFEIPVRGILACWAPTVRESQPR